MRIVFLGTPDFAVESLRAIINNGFDVVAVVTAPDKPAGRGMKLQYSPVKKTALEHNIPVLQPTNLKDPAFIEELRIFNADLQVVIAFRMLPEKVWNMPKLGTVNLHASLLPDYRGAAPINWAIINGEKESGVCTFFLKHEIDTGNIILKESYPISENTTAGELHDALMHLGAKIIVNTLELIKNNNYTLTPQGNSSPNKIAPKIFTETCRINWNLDGKQISQLIRGLSPYPGAFTNFHEKILKVFAAQFIIDQNKTEIPGTIKIVKDVNLMIACKNGWIELLEVQLEGKKRMRIGDFVRGLRAN